MTEQSLAGKVAIITGSGSPIGMGHSMAAATVEAGGRVAMLDINPDWLDESAADIRSIRGEAWRVADRRGRNRPGRSG